MDGEDFWAPHRGAVSLAFDDGVKSQLQRAMPTMDRRGIRGTFYLNPTGKDWQEDMKRWAQVALAGHEIGNHTLSHTCSKNFGSSPGLEDMTLEEVEADILAAQEQLVPLAPHQEHWTFGYPCHNTYVGQGTARQSYVPVVARHFLAARGDGEYGFGNRPDVVDLACVWGISVERMSGWEMIGLVEDLTWRGQWVILTFHEIDGSRLTVGSYDFGLLLDYLARRSDEIWTAPVVEVAGRIIEVRKRCSE